MLPSGRLILADENDWLSLAGKEIAESNDKILDVAIKYGYETAESFIKAFAR